MRALKRLHAHKCTPYDARDASHEGLLRRLWVCGFGADVKCELVSERWVHLGFQCADPIKDLRGMGILGLESLVYFGEHYADVFQRLVSAQRTFHIPSKGRGRISRFLVQGLPTACEETLEGVDFAAPAGSVEGFARVILLVRAAQ